MNMKKEYEKEYNEKSAKRYPDNLLPGGIGITFDCYID